MRRLPEGEYPTDEYLLAVGEAVFNFGLIEMSSVAYIEKIDPGFSVISYSMTAIPIADKFIEVTKDRPELLILGNSYREIAVVRNILLHARPIKTDDGEILLSYAGREGVYTLSLEDLYEFSGHCVPIIAFFSDWAHGIAVDGAIPLDEVAFEAELIKVLPKWKLHAERRAARQP